MPTDQAKYALMSKAAYSMNDNLKSKEHRMQDAMGVLDAGGVKGFSMDTQESNSKRAVFVNEATKQVVISHRGTDPTTAANLSTDFAIALGLESMTRRYKNATARDAATKEKYKGYNLHLTGHSLGGSIATRSAVANNIPASVYNPGSGLLNVSHFLKPKKQGRVTNYTTLGDPLSLTSKLRPTKKVYVAQKKGFNAHALANFY